MIKPTSKQNRESKTERIMGVLIMVLFNFLVFGLIIFLFFYTLSHLDPEPEFCDYDSCSQEATSGKWNYSGSSCFNANNSDCQDFLRFWDACQEYKRRVGVC